MTSARVKFWCALAFATALASVAGGWVAHAAGGATETRHTIPYRGYLEAGGAGVDGTVDLRFELWTSALDGELLWQEEHASVPVNAGAFSVRLGGITGLGETVERAQNLYLAIAVKAPGEQEFEALTGRQALGATPFALSAKRGHSGEVFEADGVSVNGDANVAGDVAVGADATVAGRVRGAGTSEIWSAERTNRPERGPTGMTLIPGLTVSFTLERAASVHLQANGAMSVGTGSGDNRTCRLGFGFAVDGQLRGDATLGQAVENMVDNVNEPSISHRSWNIARTETLSAGPHTVEVRADDVNDRCWVCANGDGALTPQSSCFLSVVAFYQ